MLTDCAKLSIVPLPSDGRITGGSFVFRAETVIIAEPGAGPEARLFSQQVAPAMGFELAIEERPQATVRDGAIVMRLDPQAAALGREGYRLSIKAQSIELAACRPTGLFYGCQSLRQLLPAEVMGMQPAAGIEWAVPCAEIEDQPRFSWRGHLLDTSRHFFTVEEVKRAIDLMAFHKMNVFHWHLVDDQGWRLEIRRYPKLTEVGAWRKTAMGTMYGGFYTQDDVREILAYASARHVTVVPEIEMPGHSLAVLASYPNLGCTGGPYEVRPDRGITKQVFCAGREETFQFIFNLLDEVLDLFPSQFIHIGGDECPKDEWSACDRCQKRIKAENLRDEKELQSYFIHRIDEYLANRGRLMVGWDEILEGGLAPGAVVQAWRDVEHAKAAALDGHDVILSPTSHCYLDYTYDKIPVELAHSYEAVLEELSAEQEAHILGIEGNTWTEEVPDQATYDYHTYPRLSALAEVAWSPASCRHWQGFSARLQALKQRLEVAGVKFGEEETVAPAGEGS